LTASGLLARVWFWAYVVSGLTLCCQREGIAYCLPNYVKKAANYSRALTPYYRGHLLVRMKSWLIKMIKVSKLVWNSQFNKTSRARDYKNR